MPSSAAQPDQWFEEGRRALATLIHSSSGCHLVLIRLELQKCSCTLVIGALVTAAVILYGVHLCVSQKLCILTMFLASVNLTLYHLPYIHMQDMLCFGQPDKMPESSCLPHHPLPNLGGSPSRV